MQKLDKFLLTSREVFPNMLVFSLNDSQRQIRSHGSKENAYKGNNHEALLVMLIGNNF